MFPDGNVTCGMIPRARNHWGFSGPEQGEYALNRLVYERFGSKKGLLRFCYHWALARFGAYRAFSRVDAVNCQRLVFVCSGNICRSPLAEAYARSLGRDAASCGLNCGNDFPADPRAMEFAANHGLSLDDHKTVNVKDFNFHSDDLIVVMEPGQITEFQQKVGETYTLALAGTYCGKPVPYIHDPFNCSDEFFKHCEKSVMDSVRGMCA